MFGVGKFGDGIGLGRILRFMAEVGLDENELSRRSIVITGSNGKGSTASLLASALGVEGRRVGLFTSPHLYSIHERFRIGRDIISKDSFTRLSETVVDFLRRQPDGDRPGSFELLFMIALLWFREQQVDVIVWEAGVGGRYDPVRALRSRLSVLTALELEHTELLGGTEELIAYEKIDALAHGGTVIISTSVSPLHRTRIEAFCNLTGRRAVFVEDDLELADVLITPNGTRFNLSARSAAGKTNAVEIPLIGDHQARNAAAAIRALKEYLQLSPDSAALQTHLAAMKETWWPGRLECFKGPPDLWIDAGHTPAALNAVIQSYLSFQSKERTLAIFGASASKRVEDMAAICARNFPRVVLTRTLQGGAPIERFISCFSSCSIVTSPTTRQAAAIARETAQREGLSVIVLGGLFLAAEIRHAWSGGDPADLDAL
jgi:dihydrofolate synthase/folylpolyglutamate synthase